MTTTASSSSDAHTQMPPVMAWTESLQTGDARMDETHLEFVDMINAILATPEEEQLPVYKKFLDHTVEHFAQEERWMLATGFSADNCHAEHHATILETMRVVEAHYLDSDTTIITRMAEALAEWFPGHANSMDAGLAAHLKSVGFDSISETLADPSAIKTVTMSGCGSVSCS
jgi:hemerythrin-like metal-binding protein